MNTDELIKMLRDITAGYRTIDGIPILELIMASDRLEKLQQERSEAIEKAEKSYL
jgi:hypothetical protein